MSRLEALPVAVDLPGVLGQEVAAYVEEAGWQVVSSDGPPHPVLQLAAVAVPGRRSVIVVDGTPAADMVRAGLVAGALDVIGWPADRQRLLDAPLRVPRPGGGGAGATPVVAVGGAAGGVGTSTVALAAGGLLAWSGRRVLVCGGDDLVRLAGLAPWQGPGAADLAGLGPREAVAEAGALAVGVPSVPGLAVLGGGVPPLPAATWPFDALVTDQRAVAGGSGCGLVVARPDASLRAVAPDAGPVVICGAGPLDAAGVRRLLGRSPVGWLPDSARVARAGLAGRVPASVPGSWLRVLRAALRP